MTHSFPTRRSSDLANRLQINEFTSPLIRLYRLPKLTPSQHKDGAILPGFDIRVAKLQINRLWFGPRVAGERSEEHTSELQSLMRISYAVFCLKKKKKKQATTYQPKNEHKNT